MPKEIHKNLVFIPIFVCTPQSRCNSMIMVFCAAMAKFSGDFSEIIVVWCTVNGSLNWTDLCHTDMKLNVFHVRMYVNNFKEVLEKVTTITARSLINFERLLKYFKKKCR